MANRTKLLEPVCKILSERSFSEKQISKIIPALHEQQIKEPNLVAEIVDRWNVLMGNSLASDELLDRTYQPPTAVPPKGSLMNQFKVDMCTILSEVAPDLLLLDPDKLTARHRRVQGLGLANNSGETWTLLFNAPRGFYMQNWTDLMKKILYLERNVIDLLYDKKEQKDMSVHPIVKSAASVEADFDHIRTRYLFASRTGYGTLSHLFSVQTALDRPNLTDIILSDNRAYLQKFAPLCTIQQYDCFANLIKSHDIDEDDADIYDKLAELESLKHEKNSPARR